MRALFLFLSATALFATSHTAIAQKRTASPVPNGAGCSAHLKVEVDQAAFRQRGVPFTPAEIERFRTGAASAFRAAANRLCSAGLLEANSLRRYSTLRLIPGAGAAESTFFDDPEEGRDILFFQWSGFEDRFSLPDQTDIQMGLRCKFSPSTKGCADRAP
jgi:hypothetical protein